MVPNEPDNPRGLTAPLSQAQLGSLRDLASGAVSALPTEHMQRLLNLDLIEKTADGVAVTELGRKRLVADR
jgi:hypothetical protein